MHTARLRDSTARVQQVTKVADGQYRVNGGLSLESAGPRSCNATSATSRTSVSLMAAVSPNSMYSSNEVKSASVQAPSISCRMRKSGTRMKTGFSPRHYPEAHFTQFVACGKASNLALAIGRPHWMHSPYLPALILESARLICRISFSVTSPTSSSTSSPADSVACSSQSSSPGSLRSSSMDSALACNSRSLVRSLASISEMSVIVHLASPSRGLPKFMGFLPSLSTRKKFLATAEKSSSEFPDFARQLTGEL